MMKWINYVLIEIEYLSIQDEYGWLMMKIECSLESKNFRGVSFILLAMVVIPPLASSQDSSRVFGSPSKSRSTVNKSSGTHELFFFHLWLQIPFRL